MTRWTIRTHDDGFGATELMESPGVVRILWKALEEGESKRGLIRWIYLIE